MDGREGLDLQAAALRRWGPRFALIGVLFAAAVGWAAGSIRQPREYYSIDDAWIEAAFIYMALALMALGAGLVISGWPEIVRRGPVARRFRAAERRHLAAGRGLAGRALLVLILSSGVSGALTLFVLKSNWWRSSYHSNHLVDLFVIGSVVAAFGLSVLIPVIVAAAAAVNLSSSRRSGAAENLLVAPLTADHLGWAGVESQARRGLWMLASALPFYCITLMLLAGEWRRHADTPVFFTVAVMLALTVIIELFMIRRAAALGAWMGAALPVPALGAALAALGVVFFWLVRLALVGVAFAIADELMRRSPLRFWYWPLAAVGADLVFFGLTAPLLLWLCRGSLRAPLGMRLGEWMIRTGQRLSGPGGDVELGLDERATGWGLAHRRRLSVTPAGPPERRRGLGWKTNTVGVWTFAVLTFFGFLVSGVIAQESRDAELADIIVGGTVAALLGLAVLCRAVLRFIVRRVRSAGDESGGRR